MAWIKVSDTVIVNSDKVSAIEVRNIRGKKAYTVIVEGKSYISEIEPHDLFKDFIKAGINLHDQFFAG